MDKDTLRECLHPLVVNECDNKIILTETGESASLREVTIVGLPSGSYAIKLDPIKVDKLFLPEKITGFNKHSDYLIVADKDLIAIELKSPTLEDIDIEDITCKFKSDLCVFKYCDAVFHTFLNKNPFFSKKNIYYVLLYQALPTNKTYTSLIPNKQNCTHTTPEKFATLPVKNQSAIGLSALLHAPSHTT